MTEVAGESEAMARGVPRSEAEHSYTWLEDYLERLEGREARLPYYEDFPAREYYSEAA